MIITIIKCNDNTSNTNLRNSILTFGQKTIAPASYKHIHISREYDDDHSMISDEDIDLNKQKMPQTQEATLINDDEDVISTVAANTSLVKRKPLLNEGADMVVNQYQTFLSQDPMLQLILNTKSQPHLTKEQKLENRQLILQLKEYLNKYCHKNNMEYKFNMKSEELDANEKKYIYNMYQVIQHKSKFHLQSKLNLQSKQMNNNDIWLIFKVYALIYDWKMNINKLNIADLDNIQTVTNRIYRCLNKQVLQILQQDPDWLLIGSQCNLLYLRVKKQKTQKYKERKRSASKDQFQILTNKFITYSKTKNADEKSKLVIEIRGDIKKHSLYQEISNSEYKLIWLDILHNYNSYKLKNLIKDFENAELKKNMDKMKQIASQISTITKPTDDRITKMKTNRILQWWKQFCESNKEDWVHHGILLLSKALTNKQQQLKMLFTENDRTCVHAIIKQHDLYDVIVNQKSNILTKDHYELLAKNDMMYNITDHYIQNQKLSKLERDKQKLDNFIMNKRKGNFTQLTRTKILARINESTNKKQLTKYIKNKYSNIFN